MTTTVSLANMPSTPSDVAVKFLNQSLLKHVGSQILSDKITVEHTYRYAGGSPVTPTFVRVRQSSDAKANTVRTAVALLTTQTVVKDDLQVEEAEVSATITVVTPGAAEDAGQILDMIGTAYALWFDGVTTKVPNEGIIDSINFGLLEELYG